MNSEYFHHGVGGNLQGSHDKTTVLQEGDATDLVVPAVEELPGLVVRVDVGVHCPAEVGGAAVVRHLGQGRGLVTHELLHTHMYILIILLSSITLSITAFLLRANGANDPFYPKTTVKRIVQAPWAQMLCIYLHTGIFVSFSRIFYE